MGDGFLPKLFQKPGSEDQDFSVKPGHSIYTSHQSSSYSSTKLPTIDRSKTNSIHNVPSSTNTSLPRRSRDRTKRGSMGRSPSCPSTVDFRSELSGADYQITQDESPISAVFARSDSISPTRHERELTKLPNIYQNGQPTLKARKNPQTSRDFPSWKSDMKKERNDFRRSESYQSLYNNQNLTLSNENSNINVSQNNQNRSLPQTALLLPLQTDSRANKVKNKVAGTESREDNHYDFTPRGYDNFETGVFRRYGQENEIPVEAMAHDNGHHTEDKAPSPHALEIKSRHMKQWNRSNKEGQCLTASRCYMTVLKSDSEDQDFSVKPGHSIHSSQQSSSYSSTILPTIDRSKTNSIHNVPSSTNTSLPRRSRDRTKHGSMGRSPSCPSSVDFRSELSGADYQITQGESPISAVFARSDSMPPTRHKRELTKLPNIYQNGQPTLKARKNPQTSRDFPSWKGDMKKERKGFRRSESYQSLYNNQNVTLSNENSYPNVSHNSQNRSLPQTALLLPLQTDSRANKVKNKVAGTESREDNHYDFTPRRYDNFETSVFCRYGQENEIPVEVMAHDNGHHTEDKAPSPHALEIKSRHMKQWNRSNKEGQVKA